MNNYALYRKAWRYDGPPHEEPKLQKAEWKSLLRNGGLLVRNTYDFDLPRETTFWYVIKDQFGEMEELSTRVRNKIRKAQKAFDYQLVEQSLIKEQGYAIMEETYADYAINDRKMNDSIFNNYMENQTFDCWGVFDKENSKLVGFSCVRRWNDSCEYDLSGMMTAYKHSGNYPYYGLYHAMNQYYLQELGFHYVSDGARSITEHSNIHSFLLENFLFRKAYCQLAVHYRWWMGLAVKFLYPFRKRISNPKVKAILNMESMKSQPD